MKDIYHKLLSLIALSASLLTGADIISKFSAHMPLLPEASDNKIYHVPEDRQQNRDSLTDFSVITERNIFGAPEADPSQQETLDVEQLDPTSLDIALLGTVTDNMHQTSYAVIKEAGKTRQCFFRIGDSIQNAVIGKILRGKVVLEFADKAEMLYMEKTVPTGSALQDPAKNMMRDMHLKVALKELKNASGIISRELAHVAMIPHFSNGRPSGMILAGIRTGSFFTNLGLKNGDIIYGLNGAPINARNQILPLFREIESGSSISLEFMRKGRRKQINYQFR